MKILGCSRWNNFRQLGDNFWIGTKQVERYFSIFVQNHLADGVRVGLTRDSSHQGDNNECFHIAASLTDCVWVWWEKRLYRQHLLTTGTLVHSPTHQWYSGTLTYSPYHWYTLVHYHLLTDSTLLLTASTPLLTDGTAVAQVNQDLPNSALGSARESAPGPSTVHFIPLSLVPSSFHGLALPNR